MAELGPPRMASTVRRFSVPVTRRRYPTPAVRNAEGLHAYPTPTASTILAHVFPSGGATERLPDGREVASEVEVHAPVAGSLRAGDEQTGDLPDEIVWQGATYEIDNVDEWQGGAAASSEIWLQCHGTVVVGRPAAA